MELANPDYYSHPIFYPHQFHLETVAMKQLHEEVHQWLWTGATGGTVTGNSRVGKTRAIRTLSTQIHTRGGEPMPAYYTGIPLRDTKTVLSVFRQLCYSTNLRVTNHDRSDHLSDRFVHHVADKAATLACPHAVLFVDEMQRLTPKQFNAFAEIYDKLLLLDIYLSVIFIGNSEESDELFTAIEHPHYAHIRGRFFTRHTTFHGLTSHEQVKRCLLQYDKRQYPEGGPTYTAYFLPKAVKKGWRLASLSHEIWAVFRDYQRDYHLDSWGMQYFTATIKTLLCDLLPHYGTEQFNEEMVTEAIRVSGLIADRVRPVK